MPRRPMPTYSTETTATPDGGFGTGLTVIPIERVAVSDPAIVFDTIFPKADSTPSALYAVAVVNQTPAASPDTTPDVAAGFSIGVIVPVPTPADVGAA